MDQPPVYHVLHHTPGPSWDTNISSREQPGIQDHVGYCASLLEQGKLLMGGPFLDDSGGMQVLQVESPEEAEKLAQEDPAVQSGLLKVVIRPWLVPFSRA